MNRADRIGRILSGPMTLNELIAMGATIDDLNDAASLLRLDLELTRTTKTVTTRAIVDDFIRGLSDD